MEFLLSVKLRNCYMDEEKVTGVYTVIEVRSKWVKYFILMEPSL